MINIYLFLILSIYFLVIPLPKIFSHSNDMNNHTCTVFGYLVRHFLLDMEQIKLGVFIE